MTSESITPDAYYTRDGSDEEVRVIDLETEYKIPESSVWIPGMRYVVTSLEHNPIRTRSIEDFCAKYSLAPPVTE